MLFLILITGWHLSAQEQTERPLEQKLLVRVDGLSCPFCAYGLEKKLLKIQGVESVEISVNEGEALLTLSKDTEIDEEIIRKEIKKAGFTTREIVKVDKKSVNER